ncbi:cytochrome c [Candidatus Amoebophilus asiaticus]|nr:cytochrome c [Candidatus Amoebophilus asiaticus]
MNVRIVLLGCIAFIFSCSDPNHPGYEYVPDMAHTIAYKTYTENPVFKDSSNALMPVEGTISRGHMPYLYEKNEEGLKASASLENPIAINDAVVAEGKRLYNIYCQTCHGKTGAGDGLVVTKGGMVVPPKYTDTNAAMTKHNVNEFTAGQIYHTIMVGSTIMGSYASQLTEAERWKIVHFVQTLQGPKEIKAEAKAEELNENEEPESEGSDESQES